MIRKLRILLFPFSLVYGMVLWLRNKLYDLDLLASRQFDVPVIVVGNLNVGGSGKSPHIEYLLCLLKKEFKLATLSRGYGRKTTGFFQVDVSSLSDQVGDEPLQFKRKFPEVLVAVDEDRIHGIETVLEIEKKLQVILLDDAYQHRAVKAGMNILLTDYSKPFYEDMLLPAGDLREPSNGKKRAEIIVVTKCPLDISNQERENIKNRIAPFSHQRVYFSGIQYGKGWSLSNNTDPDKSLNEKRFCLLFTGIANARPLKEYLLKHYKLIEHIEFADHHPYSINDLQKIKSAFEAIKENNKVIFTTEKDAVRLQDPQLKAVLKNVPVYYIPIEIAFLEEDALLFNQQIMDYVRKN